MAFVRSASLWGAMVGLALTAACGDDGSPVGPDGSTSGDADAPGEDATPAGNAALAFQAVWGEQARMQIDSDWRDDVPGWEADAPLVVMLCATDDPTCTAPVLVREVASEESDGTVLGATSGPTVTLTDLPEGDFLAMVMADSPVSRANGFGWNDDFPTTETAWGGVASEGDLLVSASADAPTDGHNPDPEPVAVRLRDGSTAEAGTLVLGHYHQRDISPPVASVEGVLAVAVDGGIRLLDLATQELLELGGAGEQTAVMTDTGDATGTPFDGTVCGIVRGPSTTVFLLYRSAAGGGFAVQYDVETRAQLNDGYRVLLPGLASDTPCRGLYHQFDGQAYLFVSNALAAPDAVPGDGLWYARISNLFERDVTGAKLSSADDSALGIGASAMVAVDNRLFLALSPASGDGRLPPGGRHVILVGSIAADGRLTFWWDSFTRRIILQGPLRNGAISSSAETIPCSSELGTSSLALADFHDGRQLLFLGGCLEIAAFDVAEDPPTRLDFNGSTAGEPNLDASAFGQGFAHFALSPDGGTLWAIPQRPSPRAFFVPTPDGAPIELDRQMAFPIDLSTGELPGLRAGFAENVDGYDGHPGAGVDTPAEDPGLDLGFVAHQRYVLEWAPSLGGETFAPVLDLDGILAAPTDAALWITSPGGMGKARDLASYDLSTLRGHLWPQDGEPFYGVWTGGPNASPPFGFDAAPDPASIHGILVVSTP